MDWTERKKENEGGEGGRNEQESQFTDGKFNSVWKYPYFWWNQGNTYSAAEGKHGFSNLSPCWGRDLRASLARVREMGTCILVPCFEKNDDVGFLRVYLHLILIFRKGLPVKKDTLHYYRGDGRGQYRGLNLSLIIPLVIATLKVLGCKMEGLMGYNAYGNEVHAPVSLCRCRNQAVELKIS